MSHSIQAIAARDAEVSVLGAVLLSSAALDRVAPLLKPAPGDKRPHLFADTRHGDIFIAMLEVQGRNEPVDAITVSDQLAGLHRDYIFDELADGASGSVNIEHHAKMVRDAADARLIQRIALDAAKAAQAGDYDSPDELIHALTEQTLAIVQARDSGSSAPLKTVLKGALTHIRTTYENRGKLLGLSTGFPELDAIMSGFEPGNVYVLAARPAMGKTALALNMAVAAAQCGKTVAIFSLEMPHRQLGVRMLQAEARVDGGRIKRGALGDGDIDRLLQATKALSSLSIEVRDTSNLSIAEMRAFCRQVQANKATPELGLVVIDYLQLMQGDKAIRSREQQVARLSRDIKCMAMDIGVPVLFLSQLNRGVESRPDKRPMLSDLRESGAIEQDANQVLFVYRDEYYNPESEDVGMAEVIVAKNRDGATGTAKLRFHKEYTRFDSLEA